MSHCSYWIYSSDGHMPRDYRCYSTILLIGRKCSHWGSPVGWHEIRFCIHNTRKNNGEIPPLAKYNLCTILRQWCQRVTWRIRQNLWKAPSFLHVKRWRFENCSCTICPSKPPYTVASGNLLSAIWDTSHWTSFVKFGLKTAWDISYDILWPILKYVNFWRLQGRLSNLSKKDAFRKSVFSRWRSNEALMRLGGVLGGQVPRLYGGTIFGGMPHTWGIRQGI